MDNDDRVIGRVLSRRDAMRLLAASGVASCGAWGATLDGSPQVPGCVVQPEADEGPFFVDKQLNRPDLRTDPPGTALSSGLPLSLDFNVSQIAAGRCSPLAGAVVDLWQCDAAGIYSGVSGRGQAPQAAGGKMLRGFQITDTGGRARFTTIFPGWYQGRTVHIHLKVRTTSAPQGAYEFTSQLYFDDALTDRIHATAPYASRGRRDTTNQTDGIFRNGGQAMLLAPADRATSLAATFAVGLDLSDAAIGRPDAGRGGRGRGRG
jgi:protocatechuate 3,4-dioxygenase beta subunit